MANLNYQGNIQPEVGWQPRGALAGMLYRKDRQRYDDVSSLQDYMTGLSAQDQTAKLQDYFEDAPVRQAERGSKIATANATAETIGAQKRGELEKLGLENQYAREADPLRIRGLGLDNDTKDTDLKMKQFEFAGKQIQTGLQAINVMARAIDNGGPAGVALAQDALRRMGLDKVPAFQTLLEGNPEQVRAKLAILQKGLEETDRHMVLEREKIKADKEKAGIMAAARIPGEKEFSVAIDAYEADIRRQRPDLSPTQVRAMAVQQYQQGKRYGSDPGAAREAQGAADLLNKKRSELIVLKTHTPNAPAIKQLEEEIRQLEAGRAPPNSNEESMARKPGETPAQYLQRIERTKQKQ